MFIMFIILVWHISMLTFANWHQTGSTAGANKFCRYLVINQSSEHIKIWTWWWCEMKSEGVNKVITIRPEGDVKVRATFCANRSSGRWDISQDKLLWPAGGARWKVKGASKSSGFTLWETSVNAQNFMAILPVVEIFQSGPMVDQLTRLKTIHE